MQAYPNYRKALLLRILKKNKRYPEVSIQSTASIIAELSDKEMVLVHYVYMTPGVVRVRLNIKYLDDVVHSLNSLVSTDLLLYN